MFRIFSLAFLMLALFCCVAPAADLPALLEDFYGGLADIIENNMDEPQGCVREVDAYYQDNQALVSQIQEETAKVMSQAAPMMQGIMDDYQSTRSEEELKAMERKYEGMQSSAPKTETPYNMNRYSQALATFSQKYPQYGMQIAFKAIQFMPGSVSQTFEIPQDMQQQW